MRGLTTLAKAAILRWSVRKSDSGEREIFRTRPQTGPGDHPASYKMGAGSFPGVKRPECDVNHSPHLAQRLKKE